MVLDLPVQNHLPAARARGHLPKVENEGLCKLIVEHAQLSPRRLQLIIKDSRLHYGRPNQSDFRDQDFVSLDRMIAGGVPSVLGGELLKKRYILAFLITSAFLQVCQSSWSPQIWTKEAISFRCSPREARPDITRPYLSTQFMSRDSCEAPRDDLQTRGQVHPYPQILALGFMLLQIFLWQSLEAKRTHDNPNCDKRSLYDIDADIPVAQRLLELCDGNSLVSYNNAIKACLAADTFPPGSSLGDESFRHQVYLEIVQPIAQTLYYGYGVNVEDEEAFKLTLLSEFQSKHATEIESLAHHCPCHHSQSEAQSSCPSHIPGSQEPSNANASTVDGFQTGR